MAENERKLTRDAFRMRRKRLHDECQKIVEENVGIGIRVECKTSIDKSERVFSARFGPELENTSSTKNAENSPGL